MSQDNHQIDFATYVYSLSTSALVGMGVIPHPDNQKHEKNLSLAKAHIDILGILEAKTKGNLTKEEQELLTRLLFDLRMKYAEISKS